MRLKHVWIKEYKNLRNFRFEFGNTSFLNIFVGKNGTGKSNLLEAIIEIFRHIIEHDNGGDRSTFDYTIEYDIDRTTINISSQDGKLIINGEGRKTVGRTLLPDNILVYYSGQNENVSNIISSYEERFRARIKRADVSESRFFIGVGPDYKELFLTMLLIQPEECKARQFIYNKLGIESVGQELKIELKRPYYADSNRYDIEDRENDRYWKAEGTTKDFLDRLLKCASQPAGGKVRDQGYIANRDCYVEYLGIQDVINEFTGTPQQELFRLFDNLKTLGMLSKIEVQVTLQGGIAVDIKHFSDGQFQSIYIYSIVEIFKDRNCITLLDEPDAFLHPEWQFDFLKQVSDISESMATNNHILMCSHSAATLTSHGQEKITYFDIKNRYANCYDLPKSIAINKLSSDLMYYSMKVSMLSIIESIQIRKMPILFTEGCTDPTIINHAWVKLYEHEKMPFTPLYAFSCNFLAQLLVDQKIYKEMNGLPIFGLFDFDLAFNQWNGIKGNCINSDIYEGMTKKWESGDVFAFMLPIPNNEKIKRQCVNPTTHVHFAHDSLCEIEHLFYGYDLTEEYFKTELCSGGEKIVFCSDGKKIEFAREVVPTLPPSAFETFRPMFEFIKSKCIESTSTVDGSK